MPEIVLTEDQARIVAGATTSVVIRNPNGAVIGAIDPKEAEWIAEAQRRIAAKQGSGVPGKMVQAHLAALQAEWDRTGGFDRDYMKAFLAKLRAEDGNA